MDEGDWVSKSIKSRGKLIAPFILFLIFALLPLGVQNEYHLNLLITVGINSILAMTFILLLRTGLITLAIAGFWGVGAYSSAMLVTKLGMSFWLSLPLSALIAGVIALMLGYVLIRNPGFSFVIMTMILNLLFVVAIGGTSFLGGYMGIVNIPPPDPIKLPLLPALEFVSNTQYYYLLLFLFLVVVAVYYAFYRSSIGRAWNAIGLNPLLASTLGINVFRYRLLAFVIAGATAGLMGGFYAHFLGVLKPDTFNLFKTVYVHIFAILGGVDFPVLGAIVGSLVMVFFPEFMRVTREVEPIITGAMLILLVLFLPSGILSLPGLRAFASEPVGTIARIRNALKSSTTSDCEDRKSP